MSNAPFALPLRMEQESFAVVDANDCLVFEPMTFMELNPNPDEDDRGPFLVAGERERVDYIIRAVNSFPDLLAACRGLLDAIHDSMTHESQRFHAEQIDAARAAIAKAKGGVA
jgi:hypothetical protein